jgi:hypothetical protein
MSNYTITGEVVKIGMTEAVSDKFRKREFVIKDSSDNFPQVISMQCCQDKVALLDNLIVGSNVTVTFNLKGREWMAKDGTVKYFNTVEAWKIENHDLLF